MYNKISRYAKKWMGSVWGVCEWCEGRVCVLYVYCMGIVWAAESHKNHIRIT